MRLYAKVITTFNTINSFSHGNQWTVRAGEPNTLYFQLVDLDQANLRYIPGIGGPNQPVEVKVLFPSLDDENEFEATATLVDAADGSIWKIEIADTDKPSSGNIVFSVKEGSTTRRFQGLQFMSVEYPEQSGDC